MLGMALVRSLLICTSGWGGGLRATGSACRGGGWQSTGTACRGPAVHWLIYLLSLPISCNVVVKIRHVT